MKEFIQKEKVFFIAFIFTIISVCIVPPKMEYLTYINGSVIILLFCLMAVVQGLKSQGVFQWIAKGMMKKSGNLQAVSILCMSLCFFTSMLVTNDVALLTFVPLTLFLFENEPDSDVIFVIVMETIAANLGSMVTPIGNPQNLYLYYYYNMSAKEFFWLTVPYGVVSFILLCITMKIRLKKRNISVKIEETMDFSVKKTAVYGVLFLICLLTVLKCIDDKWCLLIVLITFLLVDREILLKVDYMLLLTFICFFIFVGNISSITAVSELLSNWMEGRAMFMGILLSQVISNVPAAAMLSGFTEDAKGLLLGVDIGGLGTLVASLASLISFKLFGENRKNSKGNYLIVFTVYNMIFLGILIMIGKFL